MTQIMSIRANPRVLPKVLLSLSEISGAEHQGSRRLLGAIFASSWKEQPEGEGQSGEGRKGEERREREKWEGGQEEAEGGKRER